MLRVDCYDFYKLAFAVHPLTTLGNDIALGDSWPLLYVAERELLSFFDRFPLKTSKAPAKVLYASLQDVVPDQLSEMRTIESDGSQRILSWSEVSSIKTAATEFEAVLKAELGEWDTFFVSQKGAYSTDDLINRAEAMLSEPAKSFLSPESRADMRDCGRCLAFNLGTAAAFHIVRVTESFIIKYYERILGTEPPVKARNWGAYIRNLERCEETDIKVLGWMRQIKDEYRNPVLHPEDSITPDDALEFVGACISLIGSISRALSKIGASPNILQQEQLNS